MRAPEDLDASYCRIIEMYWLSLEQFVAGTLMITAAVVLGRLLYEMSRRNPDSILVNNGVIADLVCVFEVILVVAGPMLLLHALLTSL